MWLYRPKRRLGCEINITPLIDIVFLLIIFSMIVSQFTKVEVEELSLPEAEKGQPRKETPLSRLIVNVRKDGTIVVAGRSHSVASLGQLVAARARETAAGDVSVLIRGDRAAPWKDIAQIMQACAARNVRRVKVAVLEPGASGSPP